MATLLEKLKQKQVQSATVQPEMGNTQAAAKLLQAKTGKAAPVSAPIGVESERAAAQQVQSQAAPIQQAAKMQVAQTTQAEEQINKQAAQQTAAISQQAREVEAKKQQQLLDVESKADQAAQQLGLDKEAARSEARQFAKRMQSEEYMQKLRQEAAVNRLADETSFNEYVNRQIFGNQVSDLLLNQEYQGIINDEARSWDERMANLDINSFIDLAQFETRQDMERQKWTALGGVAEKGGEVAGGYIGGKLNEPSTKRTGEVSTSTPNTSIEK